MSKQRLLSEALSKNLSYSNAYFLKHDSINNPTINSSGGGITDIETKEQVRHLRLLAKASVLPTLSQVYINDLSMNEYDLLKL